MMPDKTPEKIRPYYVILFESTCQYMHLICMGCTDARFKEGTDAPINEHDTGGLVLFTFMDGIIKQNDIRKYWKMHLSGVHSKAAIRRNNNEH